MKKIFIMTAIMYALAALMVTSNAVNKQTMVYDEWGHFDGYRSASAEEQTELWLLSMAILTFVGIPIALLYQLPSIIAARRNHDQHVLLWIINLGLGWTFIGYIVCIIWACTYTNSAEQKIMVQPPQIPPQLRDASIETQLLEIEALKEKGLITQEEYSTKRNQILS